MREREIKNEDDNPPNNQNFLIVKRRSRGRKGVGRRMRKGRKRRRRKLSRSRRRRRRRILRCRRKRSRISRLLFWSLLPMHKHCRGLSSVMEYTIASREEMVQ